MPKTAKLILPILPDKVDVVRAMLAECGLLKWQETEISPKRTDFQMRVTPDQERQIVVAMMGDFSKSCALRGIVL